MASLLASPVHSARQIGGGFSTASTWSVVIGDGRQVFVKVSADEESRGGNLNEARVLKAVDGAVAPRLVAVTSDASILVTEDLSPADWSPTDFDAGFWAAVAVIGLIDPPGGLFQAHQGAGREWWSAAIADDRFADAIGLQPAWLAENEAVLIEAARSADTSGDQLVHGDLAPGNWCHDPAHGWCFVDWASAYRGNPLIDDAIAAVRATRTFGSPVVSERLRAHPEFVAFVGGRFAAELLDVDWKHNTAARADRIADIRASFALAAALLDLDPAT